VTDTDTSTSSEKCVIISSDGHCGADLLDYKPYLDKKYHTEFDAWASTYHDPWGDFETGRSADDRMGLAAFDSTFNWESKRRLEFLEGQGVAAEVLFPNTSPPFSPSGQISAPPPRSASEYQYRFAGIRAHNRWLVDFCSDAPGRRAGLAQLFLDDVEEAVAEVRWAKEAGLMGILLPGDHTLNLVNLFYPEYDPIWAACADLELPILRHATIVSEISDRSGPASPWIGMFEGPFFYKRHIAHLICSGVFERFPALKFVLTEIPDASTIAPYLDELDVMYNSTGGPIGVLTDILIRGAVDGLSKQPSEYFNENCYLANPFDFRTSHDAGIANLMWGADLPHSEGTSPFTREALRLQLSDVPKDDIYRLTCGNAADVFGFDLKLLQEVADRIGPTFAEIATPLTATERPRFPEETRSAAFSIAGATP
jgi:predicted TIM-barrel fold metal-dependent hydrolase